MTDPGAGSETPFPLPSALPPLADEVHQSLRRARDVATRLGHGHVASEHLVLGLLEQPPTRRLLDPAIEALGTTAADLSAALERRASRAGRGGRRTRRDTAGDSAREEPGMEPTSHLLRLLNGAGSQGGGELVTLDDVVRALSADPRGPLAQPRRKEARQDRKERVAPPPRQDASGAAAAPDGATGSGDSGRPRRGEPKTRPGAAEHSGEGDEASRRLRAEREARRASQATRQVPGDVRPTRGQGAGRGGDRQPKRDRPPIPERRPAATGATPVERSGAGPGIARVILLLAIPLTIALSLFHMSPVAIFVSACLGIVPLAGFMGEATEHLAERTGPTLGGLLNATFGNAAELIIAIAALRAGLVDLVKASITGSILGNLLLIVGLVFIAGGLRAPLVRFNRNVAGMSASMLALAVVGLVFPALFLGTHPAATRATTLRFSEAVAIVLALSYGASLVFSLVTHRRLFGGGPDEAAVVRNSWHPGRALAVLVAATTGVVVLSEILVQTVEPFTQALGLSEAFIGLIIIPVIGNAAEHGSAVLVARKGRMDLALGIALGSSTQVALLIAPMLVLAGLLLGRPMDLVFTTFEVVAVGLATITTSIITLDGETHWFEGVQLLAVYALVAIAAFFV